MEIFSTESIFSKLWDRWKLSIDKGRGAGMEGKSFNHSPDLRTKRRGGDSKELMPLLSG